MRFNQISGLLFAGLLTLHSAQEAAAQPSLKEAYQGVFLIGAVISQTQFFERDPRGVPIIKAQFSSITAENVLKWQSVHPQFGRYAFDAPDRYVTFGEANGMAIIGNPLVWHNQTPAWVFQVLNGQTANRESMLSRMRDHILTVVGHYKGRIKGWDVVNEAINEDGTMRETPWFQIIGEDYVAKAFEYAHEADPEAELHYNDFNLESEPKRAAALALIQKLQAQGVPIHAIGLQHHVKLGTPTPEQVDLTIEAFAKLGIKVMITELDVDMVPPAPRVAPRSAAAAPPQAGTNQLAATSSNPNPYADGLPDSVQQALANRYADLFAVYLKHRDVITRVTFSAVTDGDSSLNAPGRVNHPLLFDRTGQPKAALEAVIKVAPQK